MALNLVMDSDKTLQAVFAPSTPPPNITHIMSVSGGVYYLQTVGGGSINRTDFRTMFNGIMQNGVQLKMMPGTYYIDSYDPYYYQSSISAAKAYLADLLVLSGNGVFRSNIGVYGESYGGVPSVIIKQNTPNTHNGLPFFGRTFTTYRGSDIGIYDITFDQGYPAHCSYEPMYGVGWLGQLDGANIHLESCHLLNGGGVGIWWSKTAGGYMRNCVMDYVTEHSLYFSWGSLDPSYHGEVSDCKFYNYGKHGRGYGPKFGLCNNVTYQRNIHEPNRDGTGWQVWNLPYDGANYNTETGARGAIINYCSNLNVMDCEWKVPLPDPYVSKPIQLWTEESPGGYNFTNCKWTNFGKSVIYQPYQPDDNAEARRIADSLTLTNCQLI